MRIHEILSELTYGGSRCTKDCSGHRAGDLWGRRHPNDIPDFGNPSQSFTNGTAIAHQQIVNKRNGIKTSNPKVRDEKGKFQAYPGVQKRRKP